MERMSSISICIFSLPALPAGCVTQASQCSCNEFKASEREGCSGCRAE